MWTPELRPGQVKYAAIVAEIKRAIESGLLRANEPLPPQRELAFRLGVNLTTVTRAYDEAKRIGLVQSGAEPSFAPKASRHGSSSRPPSSTMKSIF